MAEEVARTSLQKRFKNPSRFLKLAEFAKIPIVIGNHAFCSLERFEREVLRLGRTIKINLALPARLRDDLKKERFAKSDSASLWGRHRIDCLMRSI